MRWVFFTILWFFCLFASYNKRRKGRHAANNRTRTHKKREFRGAVGQASLQNISKFLTWWLRGKRKNVIHYTSQENDVFFVEAPSVHLKRLEQLFVQWRRMVVQPKITSLITLGSWLTINLEKKHAKLVLFICPYNLELYFVLSTNWYYSQLRIRFDSLVCVRLFVGATTIVSKGANSWRFSTLSVFHITRIVLRIQCFYYW